MEELAALNKNLWPEHQPEDVRSAGDYYIFVRLQELMDERKGQGSTMLQSKQRPRRD